ncbi:hypothetical protein WG68_16360 [Arsukibacterium ikkense]|uniref:DUF2442 domain-containing protein n=1 Tax=Arsukibacterium ikkense TaxID=336831 RepID=A0A0M2V4Y1_9GAMM|nr:DUF2442 domain-containing protein [Arsukibacterium ikkense]KKO44213.1 hypothetical protein WG68_16360 [Arsukibacterium ikkense]
MHPAVTRVTARENYQLVIEFANGEQGILDMKPYLDFGVFKRLKETSAFNEVFVSFDTVEWRAGVDLAPEFVYRHCQRHQQHTELLANSGG